MSYLSKTEAVAHLLTLWCSIFALHSPCGQQICPFLRPLSSTSAATCRSRQPSHTDRFRCLHVSVGGSAASLRAILLAQQMLQCCSSWPARRGVLAPDSNAQSESLLQTARAGLAPDRQTAMLARAGLARDRQTAMLPRAKTRQQDSDSDPSPCSRGVRSASQSAKQRAHEAGGGGLGREGTGERKC